MLTETPTTLPAPTIDGKYRLEALVGEGAYGTVYRALHLDLKRAFALKLLHASAAGDPELIARFRREAEALGRLRHPGIVEVTDFGLDATSGSPYLVMELLDGVPLSDHLRERGALPLERALPILEVIAGAIDAAHALGVLHRDLKPGNILLGGEGGPVAKVLDFGLAELATGIEGAGPSRGPAEGTSGRPGFPEDARLTATGALLGTPLYVAPELIDAPRASRASDLYSFGVVAYEMLAGSPPFTGTTGAVLAAHRRIDPPPPPNLGAGLPAGAWEALRPALAKDPAERPASAGELVARLAAVAREEGYRRWRAREVPRRLGLAAALALPLLLAAAFAAEPVWGRLEAIAFDLRLRLSPPLPPDPRIVLVTLDSPRGGAAAPLASRGEEVARAGEAIFAAGARGLAFDILPPTWWSHVEPVQDLLIRHAERLTLVAVSTPAGTVEGGDFVSLLTAERLGARAAGMFGFINLAAEGDGVVRKGRTAFRNRRGQISPSWAAHAAASLGFRTPPGSRRFWIDYRIDPSRYPSVPLHRVAAEAEARPETFRGRIAILGGDLFEDRQQVPRLREGTGAAPGLHVQALQVDTLLRGPSLTELPARPSLLLAGLAALGAAAPILLARTARSARRRTLAAVAAALAALALSCALFLWQGLLLPWTPILAFVLAGALAPWGARALLRRAPAL